MHDRGSPGFVAPPFTTPDQVMSIQHGMHGTADWALQVRIQSLKLLADLWAQPSGAVLLGLHNQLLDLHRQLVGMAIGSSRTIGQAVVTRVFVTVADLVNRLAGNTELTAQTCHLLAIQGAGNKSEPLFHDLALLPGHCSLSRKGRTCYPCLRNEVLPLCQEAHKWPSISWAFSSGPV